MGDRSFILGIRSFFWWGDRTRRSISHSCNCRRCDRIGVVETDKIEKVKKDIGFPNDIEFTCVSLT
ncbi:MAG: hypothetical protein LDL41_04830 [Coleofasciculus sp. S288]|nr:hypothetical protein [Coleofasciculus sp. S288]